MRTDLQSIELLVIRVAREESDFLLSWAGEITQKKKKSKSLLGPLHTRLE